MDNQSSLLRLRTITLTIMSNNPMEIDATILCQGCNDLNDQEWICQSEIRLIGKIVLPKKSFIKCFSHISEIAYFFSKQSSKEGGICSAIRTDDRPSGTRKKVLEKNRNKLKIFSVHPLVIKLIIKWRISCKHFN